MDLLRSILDKEIKYHKMIMDIKFSIYVVMLLVIFVIIWSKMVNNMQMDIVKALGILNILPTSHLSSNPEFMRDMNQSSLIN